MAYHYGGCGGVVACMSVVHSALYGRGSVFYLLTVAKQYNDNHNKERLMITMIIPNFTGLQDGYP